MRILLLLLLVIPAVAQTTVSGSYWQFAGVEYHETPYPSGSCYPDVKQGGEGSLTVALSKNCGEDLTPFSRYAVTWAAPPQTLSPGKPVDFKATVTLNENRNINWTLGLLLQGKFNPYNAGPTVASNASTPGVGPVGNPHTAPKAFTYDNVSAATPVLVPGGGMADAQGRMQFTVAVLSSSTFWWNYVYKWVEARPAVSAVVNGANMKAGVVPAAWLTIYGQALSTTTRAWTGSDFRGSSLPTELDGVKVTVNGKSAFVSYISPGQINVLAPDDTASGPVSVVVTNSLGASQAFTATMQRFGPAFFAFAAEGGKHVIAHTPSGQYVAKAGIVAGLNTRPAEPGEIVTIYGTGFGPTNPATPADRVPDAAAPTSEEVYIFIGGLRATVDWAGKIGPGLYQINVRIPYASSGEQPIIATVGGVSSADGPVITLR